MYCALRLKADGVYVRKESLTCGASVKDAAAWEWIGSNESVLFVTSDLDVHQCSLEASARARQCE